MVSKTPTFPPKRPKPKALKLRNAVELSSYVLRGGRPESADGSSYGMMSDRFAEAWTHIPCPRCQARARKRQRLQLIAEAGVDIPDRAECKRRVYAVLGQGGLDHYDAEILVLFLDLIEDMGCPRCDGTGIVVVRITPAMLANPDITVWSTGSSKKGRAPPTERTSDRETEELERVGRVGNLLARLRAQDPVAAEVLEVYRAPGGDRLHHLWRLTRAGQDLLRTRTHDEARGSGREFFGDQLRRRRQGYPDKARDALCNAADREAVLLLDRATRAWNGLVDADNTERRERRERSERGQAEAILERGRR